MSVLITGISQAGFTKAWVGLSTIVATVVGDAILDCEMKFIAPDAHILDISLGTSSQFSWD